MVTSTPLARLAQPIYGPVSDDLAQLPGQIIQFGHKLIISKDGTTPGHIEMVSLRENNSGRALALPGQSP